MEPEYNVNVPPHVAGFHAILNNQGKHKKYREYTGTGVRRPPPRDPFVSWRGNEARTKPAGWTKFAVPLHKSQVLSKKQWIALLQEKGLPVTGITAAGMSLLAGWEDEGIDIALEKAVAVFAAQPRTKKFGHSKHIIAAGQNPNMNQSHNRGIPQEAAQYLAHKSAMAKERHAVLNQNKPGWPIFVKHFRWHRLSTKNCGRP